MKRQSAGSRSISSRGLAHLPGMRMQISTAAVCSYISVFSAILINKERSRVGVSARGRGVAGSWGRGSGALGLRIVRRKAPCYLPAV